MAFVALLEIAPFAWIFVRRRVTQFLSARLAGNA